MERWLAWLWALFVFTVLSACSDGPGTTPAAGSSSMAPAEVAGPTVRAQAITPTPQIINPVEERQEFAPDGILRWTDAGAFDYQVWVYADDKLTQFVEFSSPLFPRQYQFTKLQADKTYYVKVYWRMSVDGAFSSLPAFTLKTTSTVRKARLVNSQEELDALGVSGTLRWSTVPGADIYSLWIYRDSTLVAFAETSGPIPYTQFQITSLKPGVTYYAQVYARVGGQFYAGGALPITITDQQERARILNSQQELDAFAPGGLLRWSPVSGASGYQVWIYKDANSAKPQENSLAQSARAWAPKTLEAGTSYYVQVYAFVAGGKTTVGSPYKLTTIGTATYARLTNAQEELEAFSTSGTLKWSEVPGATGYQLWVFGNAGQGSVIEFGAKDDRTYQLQKSCAGAIYYVQVYAEVGGKWITGWPTRVDVTQGASPANCVQPFPDVIFTASAGTVAIGASVKLTWSSKFADSCTASDAWSGTKTSNGEQIVGPVTKQSLFTLICTGAGGSKLAQVFVTVTANATPGGVWRGIDSGTRLEVIGLVTETGEFHFIRDDNSQFFGNLTTAVNSVSGTFVGVTELGYVWPSGLTTGTGTVIGTVQPRATLNVQATFRTGPFTYVSTVPMTFSSIYYRPSSLAMVAGNYRDPDTNAVINVNSNGVIFSQDSTTGCVINGTVSIIDSMYNAYRVVYTFSGCRGLDAVLNGSTARGIATLDNTVMPEQAIIGVVNTIAGYSLVGRYPRT